MLLLAVFLAAVPRHTRSQTAAPSGGTPAIPQRVVYGQVFKHVVFLDVQANLADQKGNNGNLLRNYYQAKGGLTAAEAALLKSTAHSTVAALQAIDQQIQTAVVMYRARFSNRKWDPKNVPPLPPELQTLQTQKDNLILNGLGALQTGFGATRFQVLDTFVQNDIAPHVSLLTTKSTAPVASPPAKKGPLPPMQPVTWN